MASSYSTVRLGRIRARGRNEGVWGGFGAALSALSASVGQKCAERWIRHDRRVLRNKMFSRACTEKDREVSLLVGTTTDFRDCEPWYGQPGSGPGENEISLAVGLLPSPIDPIPG